MKKTLFLMLLLPCLAKADFTWNGGNTITKELWGTQSSWILSEGETWSTTGAGPHTEGSDMWSWTYVSNASGAIENLEGWVIKLDLVNTDLTASNIKKFQNGCTINIDANSKLTINGYSGGNDGGILNLNNNGVFSLAYGKNQGGEGIAADLMQTGVMNLTSSGTDSYTAKLKSLTATLTISGDNLSESTAGNSVVMTRRLITLDDKMSFDDVATTLSFTAWSEEITLTEVTSLEDAAVGSYMVTKDSSGYSISYVIKEALANGLNWNGGAAGTWVSSGGESIWLTNSGEAAVFAGTNAGVFKNLTGVSESVVTLSGDVVSEGIVVENSSTAYKFTGSGALVDGANAAYLTKSGTGTLTIENTGANSFSGGTEIKEGTLILGATAELGTGAIVNNGVLELAQTGNASISGAISGSGSVIKTGSGKVTLGSNGSYTGGTTINAGTLLMAGAESLGTGTITVNG